MRRRGGRDWRGQGANSYFCYVISVARAVGSSQSLGRRQSGDRLAGSLSCSYSPSLRRQCKCEGAHTHSVCVSVAVVAATGPSSRSRIQVRCPEGRPEGLPGARLWKPKCSQSQPRPGLPCGAQCLCESDLRNRN